MTGQNQHHAPETPPLQVADAETPDDPVSVTGFPGTAVFAELNPVVTTEEDREALPAGIIVRSATGTIACRHFSGVGVIFGDERPFPWESLTLPLTVIYIPGENELADNTDG